MSAVCESLAQLEVLVVDCQATTAAPRGHLLEIGWARVSATTTVAQTRLIALPACERIPPAVARLTGITERMAQDGVDADLAWRELSSDAARLARQPAPTVIHFARFEEPFLRALAHGAPRVHGRRADGRRESDRAAGGDVQQPVRRPLRSRDVRGSGRDDPTQ